MAHEHQVSERRRGPIICKICGAHWRIDINGQRWVAPEPKPN